MKELDQKNIELFKRQKNLLETFLKKGTITKEQFDKSYGDLCKLMFEATVEEVEKALF